MEHIEQDERHVPTDTAPFGEYGLDAFVSVSGARFAVEDRRLEWLAMDRNHAIPG